MLHISPILLADRVVSPLIALVSFGVDFYHRLTDFSAGIMAARQLSTLSVISSFTAPVLRRSRNWNSIHQRSIFLQAVPALSGYVANEVPSFLAGLWESVLRAVPKKKTSHMKKRHRQMAGKALKDVKSLSKCPGCGEPKRSHVLCPTCVKGMANSVFRSSWEMG